MSDEDAKTQSDVLVWANLRGIDSHGVLRIPRYAGWLQERQMNPQPEIELVSSTPACRIIDADRAPGAVAMKRGMEEAIGVAREAGIGWVIVRRTTHGGPAGYYVRLAAEQSMAGITAITSRPMMAYHGAKAAGVATSPIAIAVPGSGEPLIFDMATSSISIGAIRQARATGAPLPPDVALTSDGEPTRDAAEADIPLPMSGPKGSGLALMFECLIGVLAGHPLLATQLTGEHNYHSQNGLCVAIDIAAFTGPKEYEQRIDELSAAIKALPQANEEDTVRLPGEGSEAIRLKRETEGIPVPATVWKRLSAVAEMLEIGMPATG